MTSRAAWGHGIATITQDGTVLDTWFPAPTLGRRPHLDADAATLEQLQQLVGKDAARDVHREVVTVDIDLDTPPLSASDAYLRLHLLSHRLVPPHAQNLSGLLSILSNVVWTTAGPCAVDGFELTRLRLAAKGPVTVYGVDKFPRMVDYVVPSGVRIADADRVRLGAHLAMGTTVMHEGFINFNAGTLGASLVEGRISAGVTVGPGTDIGGGASTIGAFPGTAADAVSVGTRCLLGANSGLGISLGDDCVVEAGLFLTAGTKVRLVRPGTADSPTAVKAVELAGRSNLLFRRNSETGSVEAVDRGVPTAPALHTELN